MLRTLTALVLTLTALTAYAESWTQYPDSGCIGGSTCGGRHNRLKIKLENRPVVGVRFFARDDVGERAGGSLRVKVGDTIVKDDIDIRREGSMITIDVDAIRGNTLTIEPASDDEVKVERIEVLYGAARIVTDDRPRIPNTRPGRAGWRQYPEDGRCIGGRECKQNGTRITIVLDELPVLGVRFHAQDDIGARADGRLKVRIDENVISSYIDVERRGKVHELDVDNVHGSKLVIETANDDEVDVKDIEVLYGRESESRPRSGGWKRGGGILDEKGGCIGGDECGGTRAQIRITLKMRPIDSVTFYAHDDVGTRAGGELRVRIDDEIIEDHIDIRREGKSHTIDMKKKGGRVLIIEPAVDDEVVVEDIRVRYAY
jgi:hypothetical protein